MERDVRALLRAPRGTIDLADFDPKATPGFDGEKDDAKDDLEDMGDELSELQEKLFAHGYTGGTGSVLLVLQGMDTSGKGGVLKHTAGLFDPAGLHITSFRAPTPVELSHDFLWRIAKAAPQHGEIAVFDRSHYEDVLIARVHELVDAEEIEDRYDAINAFERRLAESGTTIIKCMLHISADTQRERLLARLDEPGKQWKFKPEDIDERGRWDDYQKAYAVAIERCNTDLAPWYVVPSDRKWYRNWAIGALLRDSMRDLKLDWPKPDYDVEEQRARLSGEDDA